MSAANPQQEAIEAVKAQLVAPVEAEEKKETAPVSQPEPALEAVEIDITQELPEDKGETLAVEMPNSWSKDKAEVWSTLTSDAQQVIADREGSIQSDYSRNLDQTTSERNALKAEQEVVSQQKIDLLKRLQATGPAEPSADMLDPNSENYDPDAFRLAEANFKKAQGERQTLENEISLEQATKLKDWQNKEIKTYEKVLPEYVCPTKGAAFRQGMADYAVKNLGITMEEAGRRFPQTPAAEMLIMAKAKKWDDAVARSKAAKTTPKPKTLSGGSAVTEKTVKTEPKAALAKKWATDRSPAAAAALLANKG